MSNYHSQKFLSISACLFLLILMLTGCAKTYKTQGYIEGRFRYIATPVSGRLLNLYVSRGSEVKQGEPLFILEKQPEKALLLAAKERVTQASWQHVQVQAQLNLSLLTLQRQQNLFRKGAIQRANLDEAQTQYDINKAALKNAEANLAAAKADLEKAQWAQDQKALTAPINALVFDTYFSSGELVSAGQPILSLLAANDIKAIFFISEKNLNRIALGDTIRLNCDNCQKQYPAKINFISPIAEYTPPVIYSTETRDKLVYRIEAALAPQDAIQLHPGQPIYVKLTMH